MKMPGTSPFRAPSVAFLAWKEDPETRCRLRPSYGRVKVDNAVVTVDQHARKRGLPTLSVTPRDIGGRSVALL
jgi:hypothetical protein